MSGIRKNKFTDCLDTIQVFDKPARENLGEDSFYCAECENSAIVSVCDGCGGLGAKKYGTFQGHTGAYIASRAVSGALRDWYHKYQKEKWENVEKLALSVDQYIHMAYEVCEPYGVERTKIMGSMVRKFPTTLALAYAQRDEDGVIVHILWVGDSRVYLLDENGLAQLTKDDTGVEDALENLISDGALTNVLSSDGNYQINSKTIRLYKPGLIFAATDGCFGYLRSPMEFEYTILKALVECETPVVFRRTLRSILADYAGDDLALGMMSFNYETYTNTRKCLAKRFYYLEENYVKPLKKENSDEILYRLWNEYKVLYERYMN